MTNCLLCEKKLGLEFDNLIDREYSTKGNFLFMKCSGCGLRVLFPQPSVNELKNYYPLDYHGFNISERGLISFLYRLTYFFKFREYVKLARRGGRILDIGCADAPYFDLLNKKFPQLKLTGVEFKDEIAKKGRKRGRNIITGTISDLDSTGPYDLIIMNNLIEHVVDPIKEMNAVFSLLKPAGFVLLETPNTDCWDFMIMNRFWASLHVPRHTYLFSQPSIELLIKKTGFRFVGKKYLLSTDNWALSVQNILQSTRILHFPIKNGRVWYYKYLLIIFVPFCLIQLFFRKTGSFVITLQKPAGCK